MEQMAPVGPIYQAGTLSGNPLAMAAGYTTLKLMTEEAYERLERLSVRLQAGLETNAKEAGIPMTINRVGSMVCPFFTDEHVINYDTAKLANAEHFRKVFSRPAGSAALILPLLHSKAGSFPSPILSRISISRSPLTEQRFLPLRRVKK